MGLFTRSDSPFWWMLLEGTGRTKESTGIRHVGHSAEIRKQLKAQAEEIYHARMIQLARARVGLPIETGETFLAFSEWYEAHHVSKHKSAPRERIVLATLRPHFGSMLLTDIKPARWTEYETKRLAEGVSISTVGLELAIMKMILTAAVGQHLEVNPLVHVRRKRTKLPPKRTVTKDDERQLLEELQDDEIRDLYLVGVGTLLRQRNLVNLRRREHRGRILVLDTKTGPHAVPLDGPTLLQRRAAMVLKRRMPASHDGFFFPTWQARFAKSRETANRWFLTSVQRAAARADLPWGLKNHGVVWHTMTRASGATRMLREFGIDIRTVQLIGGWTSLDQMAEYLGIDAGGPLRASVGRRKAGGSQ